MKKLHHKFQNSSKLYKKWHQHPRHQHYHWAGVVGVFLFSFIFVSSAYLQTVSNIDIFSSLMFRVVRAQTAKVCQVGPATGNDTVQIQQAIDNCAGGGEVRLTAGEVYTAGTIELRSGVTFNLNNATLQASGNAADFRWHSFVTTRRFSGDSNITIIGPGTISKTPGNAAGQVHLVWFEGNNQITIKNITVDSTMAQTHDAANGNHIRINGGRDILIEDVVVRGTKANAHWHTDGIALAKVTNGIVRRCDIVTTDDALWAGTGSSNILFEDCRVSSGTTALEIGTSPSEPGGANLSNITFRNMYVYDSGWSISDGGAIVFKFQDAGLVDNIVFENITIGPNVTNWIYAQRSRAPDNNNSILNKLCIDNVTVNSGVGSAKVMGDNDTRVKNMIFSDVVFKTGTAPFVNFVSIDGLTIANSGTKSDYSFAGDVYNIQVIPNSLSCDSAWIPAVCGNDMCEVSSGENANTCQADCGTDVNNEPPTAVFSISPSNQGKIPFTITVNPSLSADVDGTIQRYIWDFGDGGGQIPYDTPSQVTYTYKSAGTFTVTLVVVDDKGAKGKSQQKVTTTGNTIPDPPPAPTSCTGGQSGQGGPQTPDIDSNGCVDEGDLSKMLSCWGRTTSNAPVKCFAGSSSSNTGGSTGGGNGNGNNGGGGGTVACNDGIDNDGDGKVDFPQDPGCVSPDDNSEIDPTVGDKFNPPFPRIGQLTFYPIGQGAEIWKNHDNVNIRYYYPQMAKEIKAKNPDVLLLAANDDLVRPCDDPAYADEWYLKRADGTKIIAFGNDCYMNLTNVGPTPASGKRFNQYIAEQLVNNTDWTVFDGMFFDFWASQVWTDPDLVDLDRDGTPDGRSYVNSQWAQGLQTLISNIRALRDIPIIAHEADASSFYLNGKAYEFWTQSKSASRSYNLTTAIDYLSSATAPQIVYAGGFAGKNDYATFRADFASAQIAGAFFGHDEGTNAHRYTYLHDEYEGYLGFPLSAPQEIRPGVWVRYYDEGAVIANISGTTQTVSSADLDGRTYWRFRGSQDPGVNDGSQFTSISFQPFDGIMLFTQPLTLVTPIIIDNQPVNMTSIDQNPASYTGSWTQVPWDQTNSNTAYSLGWGWSQWAEPYAITTQAGASAVYQPNIKVPGLYEVFEWHPSSSADGKGTACSSVSVSITSADGTVQKTVNQQTNTGQWNSLGVYTFNQGTGNKVTITASGSCTTISDAIKFEYRG